MFILNAQGRLEDWTFWINIAMLIINLVFLITWVRRKTAASALLEGRWEGTLTCNEMNQTKIKCTLVVTASKDRSNKALFYYEQGHSEGVNIRGVDSLDDYDRNVFFVFNGKWKASFLREFHVIYDENKRGEQIDDKDSEPIRYNWNCKIKSKFKKPKIVTSLSGNSVEFSGVLHKS
jgi:hypothetical protein